MGRMIEPLGRSLSFGRLPLEGKVLWPMLIAAADDQGRILAEPDAVKWHVCPNVPEIAQEDVPALLEAMADHGMVVLYDGVGQPLLQILNWWEYQGKTGWAGSSKYPAPEGWHDRERYHAKGGEIETRNWELEGGFCEPPPTEEEEPDLAPTQELPSDYLAPTKPLISSEVEVEVEVEFEVEEKLSAIAPEEPATPPPKPPPKGKNPQDKAATADRRARFQALVDATGWDPELKRGRLNKAEERLRKANPPYSAAQIATARAYWDRHDWRGQKGQKPTPEQIEEVLPEALRWDGADRPSEWPPPPHTDREPIDFKEYEPGGKFASTVSCTAFHEEHGWCNLDKGHDSPHESGRYPDFVAWEEANRRA